MARSRKRHHAGSSFGLFPTWVVGGNSMKIERDKLKKKYKPKLLGNKKSYLVDMKNMFD